MGEWKIITSERYDSWLKELTNLKELRAKTDTHVFRVAYIFDPERRGLLLTGGDKKGVKNEISSIK